MTSGQYSFCPLLNADWLIQISEGLAQGGAEDSSARGDFLCVWIIDENMTSHPVRKIGPSRLGEVQRWLLRVFRLGIVSSLFLINSVIVFDTGYIKKVAEILLRRFLQRSGQKGNVWYHFDGK